MLTVKGISRRLPLAVKEKDEVVFCFLTKFFSHNKHNYFRWLAAYAALKIRILIAWSKALFSILVFF